jgi:hypothetical protein
MFEFSVYCIKPNGKIPQIGDSDNGRFLIFSQRPVLDHTYLLSLAAVYFKDSSFKLKRFPFDEEALWVFGKEGYEQWNQLAYQTTELESKSFPDAGWYIIRHRDNYCFVSCGPNGQNGYGGHAHNDKLSFELMLDGKDIIVDSGTYVYTPHPKERDTFRSTAYHNTIIFNDCEQNEIPKNLFFLPDRVTITHRGLIDTGEKIVFQGENQYAGIIHKRIITLDKETENWQIMDSFSSLKMVNGKLLFHLSPSLINEGNDIADRQTSTLIASITTEGSAFRKEVYDYSPEYGLKIKAGLLSAHVSAAKDTQTITTYIRKIR